MEPFAGFAVAVSALRCSALVVDSAFAEASSLIRPPASSEVVSFRSSCVDFRFLTGGSQSLLRVVSGVGAVCRLLP